MIHWRIGKNYDSHIFRMDVLVTIDHLKKKRYIIVSVKKEIEIKRRLVFIDSFKEYLYYLEYGDQNGKMESSKI